MRLTQQPGGGACPLRAGALLAVCALVVAGGAAGGGSAGGESGRMAAFFPELEGWTKEASPSLYDVETLYEYIDGAADLYINYDFQELAALGYEKGEDRGLIIDIYRHSTPRNAFGIYSQERPSEGGFLDIGTQGYYETGILNFVLGDYYVKLSGFYLGEDDEELLKLVAEDVAGRLGAQPGFPPAIGAFPDSGKVPNSERYIAIGFMGHGFLHSAYVAEYEVNDEDIALFIIEAADADEARSIVAGYLALAEKKGEEITSDGDFHRFKDPYQRSKGSVNLKSRGNYVWGLMCDDASVYRFYMNGIEEELCKTGLLPVANQEK